MRRRRIVLRHGRADVIPGTVVGDVELLSLRTNMAYSARVSIVLGTRAYCFLTVDVDRHPHARAALPQRQREPSRDVMIS